MRLGYKWKARWKSSGEYLLRFGAIRNETAKSLWITIANESDRDGVLDISHQALLAKMGRATKTGRTVRDYLPEFVALGAIETHQRWADGRYMSGRMRLRMPAWMTPERLHRCEREAGPPPLDDPIAHAEWGKGIMAAAKAKEHTGKPKKPPHPKKPKKPKRPKRPKRPPPPGKPDESDGLPGFETLPSPVWSAAAAWVDRAPVDLLVEMVKVAGHGEVVVDSVRRRGPAGRSAAITARIDSLAGIAQGPSP